MIKEFINIYEKYYKFNKKDEERLKFIAKFEKNKFEDKLIK